VFFVKDEDDEVMNELKLNKIKSSRFVEFLIVVLYNLSPKSSFRLILFKVSILFVVAVAPFTKIELIKNLTRKITNLK